MILGLGVPEILIILVIVLVIFGPKNLPKLGKSLGQTVKNVREGMDEGEEPKVEASEDAEDSDEAEDVEAVESDAVFCTKCGAKNAKGAAFCSACGAKLGE